MVKKISKINMAKIKRIEKAMAVIDETLTDFHDEMSWEKRCKLREARVVFDWALRFRKA